jgi:hypothetical protein
LKMAEVVIKALKDNFEKEKKPILFFAIHEK